MHRRLCVLTCAQLLWVRGLDVLAQPEPGGTREVWLVSSDSSAAYHEAVTLLVQALAKSGFPAADIRQIQASQVQASLSATDGVSRHRIVVALGVEAAQAVATHGGASTVICALIPRGSFQRVLRTSNRRITSTFTALYLDQPLERRFALIRLTLPKAQRLGVLLGPESVTRLPTLKALAVANGFRLASAQVDPAVGAFQALQQVLADSDVLLALPDPAVFNNNSIQNILLSTFRAKVPLVGFSPAYVRAGALMSVHATPAQVGLQTAGLVQLVLNGQALPDAAFEPDDFEVTVNAQVARALGLELQPLALRQALKSGRQLP